MSVSTNETRVAEQSQQNATLLPPARLSHAAGIAIRNVAELQLFADLYVKSGMAPKGMGREAVAIAVQLGMELGLSPAQAVQSIAVVNGRPSIWGPTALALVEASGLMADIDVYFVEGGLRTDHPAKWDDATAAVCSSLRRGRKNAYTTRFSVADAKRAGLWGKSGPWQQYPARMMRHRVVSHNLADNFGDVLKGLDQSPPRDDGAGEIQMVPRVAQVETAAPAAAAPAEPPRSLSDAEAADLRVADAYRAAVAAGNLNPKSYQQLLTDEFKVGSRKSLTTVQLLLLAEKLESLAAAKSEPPRQREPGDEGDGEMFPGASDGGAYEEGR